MPSCKLSSRRTPRLPSQGRIDGHFSHEFGGHDPRQHASRALAALVGGAVGGSVDGRGGCPARGHDQCGTAARPAHPQGMHVAHATIYAGWAVLRLPRLVVVIVVEAPG